MRTFILTAFAGLTYFLFSTAQADPSSSPPALKTTTVKPTKMPYPDASLASTQVHEAFTTAAKTHRRVLLDFGGNWCPDCRILGGILNIPDAAMWLEHHFVIVPINVERLNANMDIAQHYGVTIKAVPTILLLTADGRLLNKENASSLGDARHMSPQEILNLIAQWNAQP